MTVPAVAVRIPGGMLRSNLGITHVQAHNRGFSRRR
jgi:hypothetical protein